MAAKLVQVSDDGGSIWNTLPGNTGSLNFDADEIEDTIFGNTFQSNEAGLIGWSVEANARYKGFAGYQAKILKPGTPTVAADEPMELESGNIWLVTDDTKSIWDRSVAITVRDDVGGSPTDRTDELEWVDPLFGRIKFQDSFTVTGTVDVTVTYLPTISVGTIRSFTLTQTADAVETTDFATAQGNTGYKTHDPGLRTVSLEANGIYALSNDFLSDLDNRTELIIEINPDGQGTLGSQARGFFRITSTGQSGDVGALEEETITFSLNVPLTVASGDGDKTLLRPFAWRHDSVSTIAVAIQQMLTAWQDEIKIDVQYLEDGLAGEKGVAVVTDVSLSTALDAMNEFTGAFMGDGISTTV